MAWEEIKYALNSTLGTDDFKPLNTILIEEFHNIEDYISFIPSDNIIFKTTGDNTSVTFNNGGSVICNLAISVNKGGNRGSAGFVKNGVEVLSVSANSTVQVPGSDSASATIAVSKGDVLTVNSYVPDGSFTASIGAMPVFGNPITIS